MSKHQIDINEFVKATSNLNKNFQTKKVTLYYAFNHQSSSNLESYPVAVRLAHLQNVENHNVIFDCMNLYVSQYSFCEAVRKKLPRKKFVFSPFAASFERFERHTLKYIFNILRTPEYSPYEKIQCTKDSQVSMLFSYLTNTKIHYHFMSNTLLHQSEEELHTLDVIWSVNSDMPILLIFGNHSVNLLSNSEDKKHMISNFIHKSKKLVKVFVTYQKEYKQNEYFLPQYSVGTIINIVIDDTHGTPLIKEENTILTSTDDYYHPIFMSTFIGLANKLLCKIEP